MSEWERDFKLFIGRADVRIQDILSVPKVSRTSFRALAIGNSYGVSCADFFPKVSYLLKLGIS
mgnify:CR=1 FL=1